MTDGSVNLVLSYVYDGSELASRNYESDPSLMFWTSNNRTWCNSVPVQWKTSSSDPTESIRHTISIPVNISSLYLDDTVRTQCLVLSPNHDKKLIRSKAGSGGFYISNLMKEQLSNPNRPAEFTVDLSMQNYQPEGTPFLKGRVRFRLENYTELVKMPWKFTNTNLALLPHNRPIMEKTIMFGVLRTMYPYDRDNISQDTTYFPPSHATVDRVHAPVWANEVGTVPGMYYWVDYTKHPPDERFYSNLARIALERKGISAYDYIMAVDKQFESNSKHLNNDFFDAVVLLSDMCSMVSTSLPYIGDYAYTGKRKSGKGKSMAGEQVSIESFHDALRLLGGDCEDLGNLIYRVFMGVEAGRPELSNVADHWSKYGGWKDPVLQRMQKIARLYVCTGSLGSVVGAYLGQKEKMTQPPVIHSQRDNDIELGAHMWCEQMSLAAFEEKMRSANPGHAFKLYPDVPRFAWEASLPHMVGEGTGYMSPLLKPIADYFDHDKAHQQTMVNMYKTKLRCMEHLFANTETLKRGQMQRVQGMLGYIPDVRLNTFYRETTHCYTAKFMREGYNFAEFTWTYTSPRVSESSGKVEARHDAWTWGVSMRDKLYEKPNLALVVSPGYTEEEFHVVQSHLRHLPPLANPTLDLVQEKTESLTALCKEFQESVNAVYANRTASGASTVLNVMFKEEQFSKKAFRDELLKETQKIEEIYRVKIAPEFITGDITNIRLDLWMNAPEQKKEEGQVLTPPQMKRSKSVEFYAQCPALSFNGYGDHFIVRVEWAEKESDDNGFSCMCSFDSRSEARAFSEGLRGVTCSSLAQDDAEAYSRGNTMRMYNRNYDAVDVFISKVMDPDVVRVQARKSDRLRDKWLDPRQNKIDKFKQKNRGFAAVLVNWQGFAQSDDEKYTSHKFRSNDELEAFVRGIEDGNSLKDNLVDSEKSSLQETYQDGYSIGKENAEEELFCNIVCTLTL